MTSTLCIRKTPSTTSNWHFKLPIKGFIGRRFYDHDGSLSGSLITIGPVHLEWFEGVLVAADLEKSERRDFEKVVNVLRSGNTIDMWIEN